MDDCAASGAGAVFSMGADGVLAPSTNMSLFVTIAPGATKPLSLTGDRAKALRFAAVNGSWLVVTGCSTPGCGGAWPTTRDVCLDSACANHAEGDCRSGPELFECVGSCCTCNQQWKVAPVAHHAREAREDREDRGGAVMVRIMNGVPGPLPDKPVAGCHRSQHCLAVCHGPAPV